MPGRYHRNESHPYPYVITEPPTLDQEVLQAMKSYPLQVEDFIRIECLMRSEKVFDLYKRRKQQLNPGELDELQSHYAVQDGWGVLEGAHHRLLDPDYNAQTERSEIPAEAWVKPEAILDIRALMRIRPEIDIKNALQAVGAQYLCWLININYPPESLVRVMRSSLKEAHAQVPQPNPLPPFVSRFNENGSFETVWLKPRRAREKSKNIDLRTWLEYLKYYDYRRRDGLTYGQAAENVRPVPKRRSKPASEARKKAYGIAKKGYRAVEKLISKLEKPTSPAFLSLR